MRKTCEWKLFYYLFGKNIKLRNYDFIINNIKEALDTTTEY